MCRDLPLNLMLHGGYQVTSLAQISFLFHSHIGLSRDDTFMTFFVRREINILKNIPWVIYEL